MRSRSQGHIEDTELMRKSASSRGLYMAVGAGLLVLGSVAAAIGGASWFRRMRRKREEGSPARAFGKGTTVVKRSVADIYGFCSDLRNLQSVLPAWVLPPGPREAPAEWSSEVLETRPDELLVWRILNGNVETMGRMEFQPAHYGSRTAVELCVWRLPPETDLSIDLQQQVEESLRRLKLVLEAAGPGGVAGALDDTGWAPESGEPGETRKGLGRGGAFSVAGDDVAYAPESGDRVEERGSEQTGSQAERIEDEAREFRVTEGSEESFPARDAPSWTPGRS